MSHSQFIASASDLVTPQQEIRAGFLAIALEKGRRASPYVKQALALRTAASTAQNAAQLRDIAEIQAALQSAAGLSNKAIKHLTPDDLSVAIDGLIKEFLEPAGQAFVDELVYRFLLTCGDALGGQMRNMAGAIAQDRFVNALIANLALQNRDFEWYDRQTNRWIAGSYSDLTIARRARGFHWHTSHDDRTLLLNLRVPLVRNNIDLCLFKGTPDQIRVVSQPSGLLHDPNAYLALGELKGGIDPAGADEHWKTAHSALGRVRRAFEDAGSTPALFFIGAAIALSMANEILHQLESGHLAFAANMTNEDQLNDIVAWLLGL